jgi:MoxR-like ATPase
MRFNGTRRYIATEDLRIAVNAAIVLERPLLVKGEPGTGKRCSLKRSPWRLVHR